MNKYRIILNDNEEYITIASKPHTAVHYILENYELKHKGFIAIKIVCQDLGKISFTICKECGHKFYSYNERTRICPKTEYKHKKLEE